LSAFLWFLWNGVVAATAPGVAAQDAPHRKVEALERTVLHDGLLGILRASGGETARRGRIGGDVLLIEQDGQQ